MAIHGGIAITFSTFLFWMFIVLMILFIYDEVSYSQPKVYPAITVDPDDTVDIHNHLNIPISVDQKNKFGLSKLKEIPANDTVSLRGGRLRNLLKRNSIVISNNNGVNIGSFDIDPKDFPRNLHIGMVTSRWVGDASDAYKHKPGIIQGVPFVKLHNLTNHDLTINSVFVPANSTRIYRGTEGYGVYLGTEFQDSNQIFQKFIMSVPATDIYFGVVSGVYQPRFGGFQLDTKLLDDNENVPGQMSFPLQLGHIGGPSYHAIPFDFVPKQGREQFPDLDRWGQKNN